jgi:hypothetical protein
MKEGERGKVWRRPGHPADPEDYGALDEVELTPGDLAMLEAGYTLEVEHFDDRYYRTEIRYSKPILRPVKAP